MDELNPMGGVLANIHTRIDTMTFHDDSIKQIALAMVDGMIAHGEPTTPTQFRLRAYDNCLQWLSIGKGHKQQGLHVVNWCAIADAALLIEAFANSYFNATESSDGE